MCNFIFAFPDGRKGIIKFWISGSKHSSHLVRSLNVIFIYGSQVRIYSGKFRVHFPLYVIIQFSSETVHFNVAYRQFRPPAKEYLKQIFVLISTPSDRDFELLKPFSDLSGLLIKDTTFNGHNNTVGQCINVTQKKSFTLGLFCLFCFQFCQIHSNTLLALCAQWLCW